MITVYSYDPNGYYTGETSAREDPKTPGHYLLPARTTTVQPPALGANQAAQWTDPTWTIVDDYRGMWYDVATREETQVFTPGIPQPPNSTDVTPPAEHPTWVFTGTVWERTLEVAKVEKRSEIGDAWYATRSADVTYNGVDYPMGKGEFIMSVLGWLSLDEPMTEVFDTNHNTFQIAKPDLEGLRTAIFQYASLNIIHREQKYKAIDDATTIAAVDGITW